MSERAKVPRLVAFPLQRVMIMLVGLQYTHVPVDKQRNKRRKFGNTTTTNYYYDTQHTTVSNLIFKKRFVASKYN